MAALVLVSCTKDKSAISHSNTDYSLSYTFDVGEQISVSHYIVEISINGTTWEDAGMILASDKEEDHYTIKVDASHWFKDHDMIMSRIKSVDIDGKMLYSIVSQTRLPKDGRDF